MPFLPVSPTRDTSSASASASSPPSSLPTSRLVQHDSMLAVPLLRPLSAHQGPSAKKEQQKQQQPQAQQQHFYRGAQPVAGPQDSTSPHKPKSNLLLPFPGQHVSISDLQAPPGISLLQPPPPSSVRSILFPSPLRPQHLHSITSSYSLPSAPGTQDSLSASMSLTSIDTVEVPFNFRGPLGHPLRGRPAGVALGSRPSVPPVSPHPPSATFSMSSSSKRQKSIVRNPQSPRLAAVLPEREHMSVHENRHARNAGSATPAMSYSPVNLSVLNTHGGLDMSRRRHHPFPPDTVPYPRNYEHTVVDLDVWDTLWLRQACKSVTFHKFKEGDQPKRVLDVGCGPGTWILECARAWKVCLFSLASVNSTFVGLDIVPIQPDPSHLPPDLSKRVKWVRANFLERLPFPDGEFDFIHIKRIARGVPEDMWDTLFEELARVMKPGAALEIIEEDLTFPGRPANADEGSGNSSVESVISTISEGNTGDVAPHSGGGSRHAGSTQTGQGKDLESSSAARSLASMTGSVIVDKVARHEDVTTSGSSIPSSLIATGIGRGHISVGTSTDSGRDDGRIMFPSTGHNQDHDGQPSTLPVQRSRSLTLTSPCLNMSPPGTPQPRKCRKRPATVPSELPQAHVHSPSPKHPIRMTAGTTSTASRLSLSRKRSKSKQGRPSTADSAPSPASVPMYSSTLTSASFPPPSITSSTPWTSPSHSSPLSRPPKPKRDAAAQAVLMETGMPHHIMTPFPGARLAAMEKSGLDKSSITLDATASTAPGSISGTADSEAPSTVTGHENTVIRVARSTVPENPRDHTILETIYNEMHAERFVNLTPLSLLGNALGLWFKDVRTHAPIMLRLPPPRADRQQESTLLSVGDLAVGTSRYASFDDAPFTAAIPPAMVTDTASAGSTTALTGARARMATWGLPNGTFEVDLRTLDVHLGLRAKEVLGCAEAMWDWVVDYQTKTQGGDREPRGVYALISELSRAEFDDLLAKFMHPKWELRRKNHTDTLPFSRDMEEHMAYGGGLSERMNWTSIPDATPLDKRVFLAKWHAYVAHHGGIGVEIPHPSTRLSRSLRVFVAWKPPA
ncbi:hypothetical protein ID866_8266 [Astraeus odoratus]|nr:hypothetical protein ID866_8266 [Astraeus odoratus]